MLHSPFKIREATLADVPALADLHVRTFNETHGILPRRPTYRTRKFQWEHMFHKKPGSWFCFVIENEDKELIGFAKGMPYNREDNPDFSGELNKIYILNQYQKLGLGSLLVGHVAKKFLELGISSMLLFSETDSQANNFYEALGAEKLFA